MNLLALNLALTFSSVLLAGPDLLVARVGIVHLNLSLGVHVDRADFNVRCLEVFHKDGLLFFVDRVELNRRVVLQLCQLDVERP